MAKDRSGAVEALRVLHTTRKMAIKCRRATLQQLHNTIGEVLGVGLAAYRRIV